MTFQCVLVIQSSLSLYPKLIDTKNTVLTKLTIVPKSARRTSSYADIVWFCVKLWVKWAQGLPMAFLHRGWGKCNLPSGKANKGSKSKPILTQNVNFTLLFAMQHEIPIAPKRPLSRWEMLSPSDFLRQNWLLKARTGCVFSEKSCPKIIK